MSHVCIVIHVFVNVTVCMCVYMYGYACMHICVYVSLCMYDHLWSCMYVCMYGRICMYDYCVHGYVCSTHVHYLIYSPHLDRSTTHSTSNSLTSLYTLIHGIGTNQYLFSIVCSHLITHSIIYSPTPCHTRHLLHATMATGPYIGQNVKVRSSNLG